MFCVRREDRESEWLALIAPGVVIEAEEEDGPQPWPLHEAVAYVNQWRQFDDPLAVFKIDEGDSKENPPRQVYPSKAM